MGEIIQFTGTTILPIEPNTVVSYAKDLKESVVIGWDTNDELYVAGSKADVSSVVFLLQLANKRMLELVEAEE